MCIVEGDFDQLVFSVSVGEQLKIISDRTDQRHVDAVPILITELRQTTACINHIAIAVKQLDCV